MKVLVTGINGFVGTILRRSLEERGYRVTGIDTQSQDACVCAVDITDRPAVDACVAQTAPDFIIHLAAISRVDFSNPALIYSINVTGTLNLLAAAAQLPVKPRFLLVSSSQVYGIVDDSRQPIDELTAVNPVNHYGASKASAEHVARVFNYEHGLPVAIVRPFNHIGLGQDPHFVIPKIVTAVKEKKSEITLGNLSVVRDFMDVRDVAEAYIRILESFPDGGTYNIASGTGYRLSDLLDMIVDMAGVKLKVKQADALLRKNEIIKAIGNTAALKELIRWEPARGIRETLQWMISG
jgi:GDP-6-deoxy-D-talose 4-dehydrogenase